MFGSKTSQVIVLGQKLVLEVESGGFPMPQVTWYLNEEQVNSDSSRHIREQGTHFLLIVSNVRVSILFNLIISVNILNIEQSNLINPQFRKKIVGSMQSGL